MPWHVAIVARYSHRRVELELARRGHRAFYPRLRRWVSHARRKVVAERPLLGTYLFVDVTGPLPEVPGLQAYIASTEGQPAIVPDDVVTDLLKRQLAGEFDATTVDFPVGALVMIVEGEFAEQLATITGSRRGKVSFVTRGSNQSASTRLSNVSALTRPENRSRNARGRSRHPPGGS